MPTATDADVTRMRDQLFFEGPDIGRRLSRFWLLLVLAAVIASAGEPCHESKGRATP